MVEETALKSDISAGTPNSRRRQQCEGLGKRVPGGRNSQYKGPEASLEGRQGLVWQEGHEQEAERGADEASEMDRVRSLGFILGAVGRHKEFGGDRTEVPKGADTAHLENLQLRIPDDRPNVLPTIPHGLSPGCPARYLSALCRKGGNTKKDLGGWGCLLDHCSQRAVAYSACKSPPVTSGPERERGLPKTIQHIHGTAGSRPSFSPRPMVSPLVHMLHFITHTLVLKVSHRPGPGQGGPRGGWVGLQTQRK